MNGRSTNSRGVNGGDVNGRVCVVGSFMADMVAYAPRRPGPGETLVGTDFAVSLGGKGFNQAMAARRAGSEVSLIGMVGTDDLGRSFLAELDSAGIDMTGVATNPAFGTGVGLPVVEPDGQNSIIIVPRSNHELGVEHVRAARSLIEDADVLLLQLETPPATVTEAAAIAWEAGTTTVLNPAPWRALPPELLTYVDVLVPNEVELRQLRQGAEAPVALAHLCRRYGLEIVVTRGEAGVSWERAAGDPLVVPAYAVEAVDTVGAGDTFCGALAARLAAGEPLDPAIRFANAAAALAVTRRGGACAAPSREEVIRFLATNTPVGLFGSPP